MGPLGRFVRTPHAHRVRGFTLLEVLVVVAIIAIAAGVAVMASSSDDHGIATREAKRLAGALEHASSRAQGRAETLGVSADGSGWRFWRRPVDATRWIPVTDDDVLLVHTLPDGFTVIPFSFAGQPLPPDAIVPLRASGRNEPFAFIVRGRTSRVVLAADPLNRVTLQADADTP